MTSYSDHLSGMGLSGHVTVLAVCGSRHCSSLSRGGVFFNSYLYTTTIVNIILSIHMYQIQYSPFKNIWPQRTVSSSLPSPQITAMFTLFRTLKWNEVMHYITKPLSLGLCDSGEGLPKGFTPVVPLKLRNDDSLPLRCEDPTGSSHFYSLFRFN